MTHLDTHVAIFISTRNDRRTRALRRRLESDELVLSPVALLEMQLLFELGRVTEDASTLFADLAERFAVRRSEASMSAVIDEARALSWTRDPIDRLIVANAAVDGAKLLTFDGTIHENFAEAIWK